LQYIAALYDRYREAVIICVVIYLFRCKVETSPHVMGYDDREDYLVIRFRVICLWEQDPEPIVTRHLMPFYILLPGMKNPSLDLLREALREMTQHYSRPTLGYRLMWFSHILRRTDTMSEQDKQTIEEELGMLHNYDELVRDDPVIQRLLIERELEGKALGKIEDIKDSILSILSIRFSPALADQAQSTVMFIQDYEALKRLHRQLLKADDEKSALLVLDLPDE